MDPTLDAIGPSAATGTSVAVATIRMVIAIVALSAAAWAIAYWRRRTGVPRRRLQVVERTFLARGASVALVRVEDRHLLVGVSSEGVRLLRDLDAGPAGPTPETFRDVLARVSDRQEVVT